MSRHADHVAAQAARLAAKHPLEHELTRLKVIHRCNRRAAIAVGSADMVAAVRQVRRWMRPVRRALWKIRRTR